ncbi:MAG: HEAT repeat domain-containing protein [Cyanobacteria bacterium SZAS-4]|nr:HEAT repeat domain-containing protein [Cyanobacteria bacterium SZAS-4]
MSGKKRKATVIAAVCAGISAGVCALGLAILPGAICERAFATIMPYPAKIAKLADESTVVLKVKVISVQPLEWAKVVPLRSQFWATYHARLNVVSVLKGTSVPTVVDFIYRSDVPAKDAPKAWINCGPENDAHFKLEPQRCYIIFAKKMDVKDAFIQTVQNYTMRPWEGFIHAADDAPIKGSATLNQTIWNELTKQLHDKNASISTYGAQTLLNLSADKTLTFDGSDDFSRKSVLDLLFSTSSPVAALNSDKFLSDLIQSVGATSPYFDDSRRMRYLWSKADKPMGSWADFGTTNNTAVVAAVPFLIRVADAKHDSEIKHNSEVRYDSEIRAKAISALGLCQTDPRLASMISAELPGWLAAKEPAIRAAAIYLSADYPDKISAAARDKAMHDMEPSVRQAAAFTAAVTKSDASLPQLEKLLADRDAKVRGTAALALLAFPVPKVTKILHANLSNPDFGLGFLCRLALFDPASVREKLLIQCQKKTTPMSDVPNNDAQIVFQNGIATSPHSLAQRAMLQYLDDRTSGELSKSEFVPYLNCMEQFSYNDPSMTGRAYEILISHRLSERAASFKKRAIAAQPTIPMVAFDQPDMLLRNGELKYK